MKENNQTPWQILGIGEGASNEDVQSAFRRKAKELHPDYGGNPEEFIALYKAAEQLLSQDDIEAIFNTKPGSQALIEGQTFFVNSVERGQDSTRIIITKVNPRQLRE